jgi:hypothetical protein
MQVTLRITKRESNEIEREFFGGPRAWFDADIISGPNAEGKRKRLTIPGSVFNFKHESAKAMASAGVEHLSAFFAPADIVVEFK